MSYKQRLGCVLLLLGCVSFAPAVRATADDGQAAVASAAEWLIDWGNALWAELAMSLGEPAQAAASQGSGPKEETPVAASPYIDPRG